MYEGKEVGIALYFYNFSTFLGRAGIYLEDLFVLPGIQRNGVWKGIAKKDGFYRRGRRLRETGMVLSELEQPSIDFYLSMNAKPMDEWTVYRLTGDTLRKAAE